ncbi:hypothetical protein NLG97_g6935 [Lecanicillium saksenae]|uniref:Uncharacterized protein n=1 Tax=Lecanicillium saksenae TaxID=468837 RepID=A0ACC1QN84_9HYPO|nr:hypothetical protein NLG97_g6935 [Lecanicillium saksenae]
MPADARARRQPRGGQRVLLAKRPKTYQGHKNEKFAVGGCFGVLEGAPFIASASEDGDIVLWDVISKNVLQRVAGHEDGVCFWVDVHGETMVSAGQDHTIRVYRHVGGGGGGAGAGGKDVGDTNGVGTNGTTNGGGLLLPANGGEFPVELPIRQEDVEMEL